MKTIKTIFLTIALALLGANEVSAQTDLLIGYRSGSTYSDSLSIVDTTGGTFTITSSVHLTTDFADDVAGVYGLALHPFTDQMYTVYQVAGGDNTTRRLGTLNTTDGNITDIGECGNITDITFVDATLYSTSGTVDEYRFGKIDLTTAEVTTLYTHLNADWSNAITFDRYNGRILKSTQSPSTWDEINVLTLAETPITFGGSHTGWTTALVVVNAETIYTTGSSNINTMNSDTYAFSSIFATMANTHSMAFATYPISLWVNGPRFGCDADGTTELVVTGGGTDFTWFLDGVEIDGADAATYEASESGVYTVEVDGELLNPAEIDFSGVTANFAISENPAFLEGAASVNVNFFETTSGSVSYNWDSGNGETSTDENPTFNYDAIGTYTVEFTVIEDVTGCEDTQTKELVVAGGVGLNELEIKLDIYPVPANDLVTVYYNGTESYTLQLVNINGEIIETYTIQPNNNNSINVSDLAPGNYVFNVTDGTNNSKYRFVKQ